MNQYSAGLINPSKPLILVAQEGGSHDSRGEEENVGRKTARVSPEIGFLGAKPKTFTVVGAMAVIRGCDDHYIKTHSDLP